MVIKRYSIYLSIILLLLTTNLYAQGSSVNIRSESQHSLRHRAARVRIDDDGNYYDGRKTVEEALQALATGDVISNATFDVVDTQYIEYTSGGDLTIRDSVTMTGFLTLNADPTNALHAATKEYVDTLSAGIEFDFFLNNTASDIGTYFEMKAEATGEAESSFTETITADATLIDVWATASGDPALTTLAEGAYELHFHADTTVGANVSTARIYFEFYKRSAGGAETLLTTSEESNVLTSNTVSLQVHANLITDEDILVTDRLVIKVYGNIDTSRPSDPDVTIYAEGLNATRFAISTTSTASDNRYFVKNGLSGGQIAYGGNATGDDLELHSTSHATKGTINLGDTAYVDEVNNRLGIGIAAPTDLLHLYATGADTTLKIESATDDAAINIHAPANEQSIIRFKSVDDNRYAIYRPIDSDDLRFYDYGTAANVVTFQYNSGNVGIGYTEPTSPLNVNGLVGIGTDTPLAGDGATNLLDIGGSTQVNAGVEPITTITADLDSIVALQLQNVNAGTSASMRFIAACDTGGYMAFTTPSDGNTGNFSGVTKGAGVFWFYSANGTGDNRDMVLTNLSAGNVTVAETDLKILGDAHQLRLSSVTTNLADSNSIAFEEGTSGAGILLQYDGAAPTAGSLKIQNLGDNAEIATFTREGNVGIGDTSPDTHLVVQDNDANTTPNFEVDQLSTGDASMMYSISGDSYAMGIDNSSSDRFKISYANSAGGAVLGTNDRLTISSSGAVDVVGSFSANSISSDTSIFASVGDITANDGAVSSSNEAVLCGGGAVTFAVDSNCVTLTGDVGANVITTITGGNSGQILTLIFVDNLVTLNDDNAHNIDSMDLTGNLNPAADTVLQLIFNGASWFQVSAPSVN